MTPTIRRVPLTPPTVFVDTSSGEVVLYADPSVLQDVIDHMVQGIRLGALPTGVLVDLPTTRTSEPGALPTTTAPAR